MSTLVKMLSDIALNPRGLPDESWKLKVLVNDDNLTYLAWNSDSHEGIIVDPVREDWDLLLKETRALKDVRWSAVIDTHTHADHVSCACSLAKELGIPSVMTHLSPCSSVTKRVSADSFLAFKAAPMQFLLTPGHTSDGMSVIWGPFLFTGDTILHGDTGRDDLPTGDAEAHYDSLQKIKKAAAPHADRLWMLPGHDGKGGRATLWSEQMKINSSLTQSREEFVPEAAAFTAPPPKKMEESIRENTK